MLGEDLMSDRRIFQSHEAATEKARPPFVVRREWRTERSCEDDLRNLRAEHVISISAIHCRANPLRTLKT